MKDVNVNAMFTKCDIGTGLFPFAVFNTKKGNKLVLKVVFDKNKDVELTFFVKNIELSSVAGAEDILGFKRTGWQQGMEKGQSAAWACVIGYSKAWVSNHQIEKFLSTQEEAIAEIKSLIYGDFVSNANLGKVKLAKKSPLYPNELSDLNDQLDILAKAMHDFDFKGEEGKSSDAKDFMDKFCPVVFQDEYGYPLREETKENIGYAKFVNTNIELKVTTSFEMRLMGLEKFPLTTHQITGGDRTSVAHNMLILSSSMDIALVNLKSCMDGVFAVLEDRIETLNKASLSNLNDRVSQAIGKPPEKTVKQPEVAINKAPKKAVKDDHIQDAEFATVPEGKVEAETKPEKDDGQK